LQQSPAAPEGARSAEHQLVCTLLITGASPDSAREMPRVAGND